MEGGGEVKVLLRLMRFFCLLCALFFPGAACPFQLPSIGKRCRSASLLYEMGWDRENVLNLHACCCVFTNA